MRLLMVTTSMSIGGVQAMVRDLSSRMLDLGHEVGVVSLTGRDDVMTAAAVERWELGFDDLKDVSALRCLFALRRLVRRYRPDVVHAHAFHANAVAGLLRLVAPTAPPVVRTIHSIREGGRLHTALDRLTGPLAVSTVCVSDAVRVAHRAPGATVIRNGIDVRRFAFSPELRRHCRDEWNVGEADTLVVSVGRMTAAKGYATFIDALQEVDLAGLGLKVVLVGDGPELAGLRARVRAGGMDERVRLPGYRGDIPAVLSAADVYVQSSHWEGFPVALLEATASGLPVIATDVGGTRELRPAPVSLMSPGDRSQLRDAVRGARTWVRPDEVRLVAGQDVESLALDGAMRAWLGVYEHAAGGR